MLTLRQKLRQIVQSWRVLMRMECAFKFMALPLCHSSFALLPLSDIGHEDDVKRYQLYPWMKDVNQKVERWTVRARSSLGGGPGSLDSLTMHIINKPRHYIIVLAEKCYYFHTEDKCLDVECLHHHQDYQTKFDGAATCHIATHHSSFLSFSLPCVLASTSKSKNKNMTN